MGADVNVGADHEGERQPAALCLEGGEIPPRLSYGERFEVGVSSRGKSKELVNRLEPPDDHPSLAGEPLFLPDATELGNQCGRVASSLERLERTDAYVEGRRSSDATDVDVHNPALICVQIDACTGGHGSKATRR